MNAMLQSAAYHAIATDCECYLNCQSKMDFDHNVIIDVLEN